MKHSTAKDWFGFGSSDSVNAILFFLLLDIILIHNLHISYFRLHVAMSV
jgi:hypothetical protein